MLNQRGLFAPLRHRHFNLTASQRRQCLLQQFALLDFGGQQHQPRHRLAVVELRQERRENFGRIVGAVGLGIIGPVAPVLERAEEEHLDAGLATFLRQAEDIRLADRLRINALRLGDETHCLDAVAIGRGALEIQRFRRLLHLPGKVGLHRLALAIEKGFRFRRQRLIGRWFDIVDARRRAALDLVQQAGPGAVAVGAVGASPDQEGLLQRVDGAVDGTSRSKWPEIGAFAIAGAAVLHQLGYRVIPGDQDIGKRLVVAQHDVEAGFELLDQIGLEQQRLGLGIGGDELHVDGERDHRRDAAGVTEDAGIIRHPVLEVPRLADIDDIALGVIHPVNPRLARQPCDEIADDIGAGG